MEKLINATKASPAKLLIIYTAVLGGTVVQYITLPLFIASFDGSAGAFFVLFWLGFLFNLVFWLLTLIRIKQGVITQSMKDYTKKRHWLLILLGFSNALNGILIVYSSPLSRTPGSLQAIFSCAGTPFTVIFSKLILRKTYPSQQLFGVLLNIMGIAVSLIPIINNFAATDVHFIWPFLFLLGQLPVIFQSILQEKLFQECPKYDSIFLTAWMSLYQIISFLLLFWVDIIPGFGISKNITEWAERIVKGLVCFFNPFSTNIDKCSFCAMFGLLFAIAYCFSAIYSAELMKYASANSSAIITSALPAVVVFFWILFPSVNIWGDGEVYTRLDIICDIVALPIIIMGIVTYRVSEEKQIKEIVEAYKNEEVITAKLITEGNSI
jgi:hypothetical protein